MYDTLGGWKAVIYFNQFNRTKDEYSTVMAQHISLIIKLYLYNWLTLFFQTYVLNISLFITYFYTIYQIVCGNRSVGYLIILLSY